MCFYPFAVRLGSCFPGRSALGKGLLRMEKCDIICRRSGCGPVGRAPGLGPGRREFESRHSDHESPRELMFPRAVFRGYTGRIPLLCGGKRIGGADPAEQLVVKLLFPGQDDVMGPPARIGLGLYSNPGRVQRFIEGKRPFFCFRVILHICSYFVHIYTVG